MRPIVYRPFERPEVEVLIDGCWHYGQLRMWTRDDSGWRAQVTWTCGTAENRIDTFPSDRVRRLETLPGGGDSDSPARTPTL